MRRQNGSFDHSGQWGKVWPPTNRLPLNVDTFSLSSCDCWSDGLDLLTAKCSILPVVGIESGDSEAGMLDARFPSTPWSAMLPFS